jgi:hypothetical protein
MICWTWWLLAIALAGAAALGFMLHFVWHWWLLSRPDV